MEKKQLREKMVGSSGSALKWVETKGKEHKK